MKELASLVEGWNGALTTQIVEIQAQDQLAIKEPGDMIISLSVESSGVPC